ncbi:hypothetical protein [Alteromonas sp. PRIM-21]|uniref:hypothetical protein n=1 Tax=Alteromonas sp. PRIM-21 TaxID=1454978 RepID=UPI0022B98AA8|nr:hypothetical protein [Alteromonas sp. PRIM-21]MCZ8531379.1 class I SAM-dependent methyltransferase [Alteromonas sp. PRIM-21]
MTLTPTKLEKLAQRYNTDKGKHWHNYTPYYEDLLNQKRDRTFSMIEIGVGGTTYAGSPGASISMWSEYLPFCDLHGIDIDISCAKLSLPNTTIHIGDQEDKDFLNEVFSRLKFPLEVVIDDGSHINSKTIKTFNILFKKIAPGGIYIIEDTHCTYEKKFDNNRDEFDKFLLKVMRSIDTDGQKLTEHNMQDFTKIPNKVRNRLPYLQRWVEKIHYSRGLCVIYKRSV